MDQRKGESTSLLDSPETITKRIEEHIVRSALDEERRARKALILLKARDKRIAFLENKIAEFEKRAGGDYSTRVAVCTNSSNSNSSFESTGRDTTYLSLPPTEAPDSHRCHKEIKKTVKMGDKLNELETLSIPRLKLPISVSNSEHSAVILKDVNSGFENSSLASDEFRHEESSVDLVVTAALAFSKFNEDQWHNNDSAKVPCHERMVNENEEKKIEMGKSSMNFNSTMISSSLPAMRTRKRISRRHSKRGAGRKIGRLTMSNLLRRNLEEVQAGLDALLSRNWRGGKNSSMGEKQKVEDKVVHEDAQEAASTPHHVPAFERKTASTQTCTGFYERLYDPTVITSNKPITALSSKNNVLEYQGVTETWDASDDPAPQWLIEEVLNRGQKFSKNNRLYKTDYSGEENGSVIAPKLIHENIISDLEKQLCATRSQLAEALNEQSIIKNKYKKALKNVKTAADEKHDELQQKLMQICTLIFDKFGPYLMSKRPKIFHKKHFKSIQHFGKLSRKLHRKLRIATLTSTKLKQEMLSVRKDLHEKTHQYDSMVKCFANLKMELKNTEKNLNDLLNENVSLRKRIDDAREWMQTRVGKERNEKINAAQFREIQRSRELVNLKKKSEEDISTIAQLRSKLQRAESANSNKGFLLNSYKVQLADLSREKEKLSNTIKELENENSSLRNSNAQLKASVTLINDEKEKLATESEKSESEMKDRMQTKLATKYERSMLHKMDVMKEKYDKVVEETENKLNTAENLATQYFGAIKRFLKEIHTYYQELDAERDLSCSEASEREAHETACTILNITPGELTNFLRGRSSNTINSWLSDLQKITSKKSFAVDLGNFLFARAIGSTKN